MYLDAKELFMRTMEQPCVPMDSAEDYIKMGFDYLDHKIGGFRRGDLILLGGMTGIGKTQIAYSILVNVCFSARKKCLFFSFGQSRNATIKSLLKMTSFNDYSSDDFIEKSILTNISLWIGDPFCGYIEDIEADCMRCMNLNSLDLVVIDYLQLIDVRDKNLSWKDSQSMVLRRLKRLAVNLDCPILVLSAMDWSKGAERYEEICYETVDAESEYADTVILVERDGYDYIDPLSHTVSTFDRGRFLVVRNRRLRVKDMVVYFRFDQENHLVKTLKTKDESE